MPINADIAIDRLKMPIMIDPVSRLNSPQQQYFLVSLITNLISMTFNKSFKLNWIDH